MWEKQKMKSRVQKMDVAVPLAVIQSKDREKKSALVNALGNAIVMDANVHVIVHIFFKKL